MMLPVPIQALYQLAPWKAGFAVLSISTGCQCAAGELEARLDPAPLPRCPPQLLCQQNGQVQLLKCLMLTVFPHTLMLVFWICVKACFSGPWGVLSQGKHFLCPGFPSIHVNEIRESPPMIPVSRSKDGKLIN